ncbi:MAG: hypothetical protein ACM37W_05940 [Actinomycetota bacterium]
MTFKILWIFYLVGALYSGSATDRAQTLENSELMLLIRNDTQRESLPKNSLNIPESKVKNILKEQIQTEVNRTLRRTAPLRNTWLVILLMVSTVTVAGLWLLLIKLIQRIKVCREELETLKYDTISHIHYLASDAKSLVQQMQEEFQLAQQQTDLLNTKISLLSGEESPYDEED